MVTTRHHLLTRWCSLTALKTLPFPSAVHTAFITLLTQTKGGQVVAFYTNVTLEVLLTPAAVPVYAGDTTAHDLGITLPTAHHTLISQQDHSLPTLKASLWSGALQTARLTQEGLGVICQNRVGNFWCNWCKYHRRKDREMAIRC